MAETARIESTPPRTKICGNNLDSMAPKKRGEAFGFESGIRLTEKILQETIQTNRHKGRQAILTNNESQKKPAADASGDGRTGREMEGREDEGGVE